MRFFKFLSIAVSLYAFNCSSISDFKDYNGHYYTVTKDKMTFLEAKQFAEDNGCYLAIPNDSAENNFLKSLIPTPKYAWIGIYDPNYMTNYCYNDVDCAFDDSRFETVKGNPLTYTNWADKQPDNLVKPYDIQNGKKMVSPLGEHWVAMSSLDGKWADFGNHFDEYNNPVKFYALIECDRQPDCYTPPSDVNDSYGTTPKCNTQIYDNTTDEVAPGKTYDCLQDPNGEWYCPAALAPCGETWSYEDGYSIKYENNVTDYKDKVTTQITTSYPATQVNINITDNPLSSDGVTLYGPYKKIKYKLTDEKTYMKIKVSDNKLIFQNCDTNFVSCFDVATININGCKISLEKKDEDSWKTTDSLNIPYDLIASGMYIGGATNTNYVDLYYDDKKNIFGRIIFDGCSITTYTYDNINNKTYKGDGFYFSSFMSLVAIPTYTPNNHLLFGGYMYGSSFWSGWISIYGEIQFSPYGCPNGGSLNSDNQCVTTETISKCPDGYTDYNVTSCKKTIEYTYYEYLCSGTNEYNQTYEPIDNGGDCHPASENDLIDTNGDGVPDSCNSPTPPPNNCKARSFTCVPAPDRKCVYVDNQWQCSPFPCLGEGAGDYNITTDDTPVGIDDKKNDGWNDNGTCSGQIYIFNGQDYRCRSDDAFFGLTGGGCCDKDKVFLGLVECKEDEKILARKNDNGMCHYIGEYCSKKLKLLFGSICIQHKKTYCCFNSKLARLIQEQGRVQLGISWGDARHPNCRGFTPEEFQKLDFSKMDLSEYYNSLSQSLSPTIQQNINTYIQNKIDSSLENVR